MNLIETGTAKITVDDEEYVLKDGDMILMPADSVHSLESLDPEKEVTYIEVKWL